MQRALIMFLFIGFLSGCGFTLFPKLSPIAKKGYIINIYPSNYMVEIYDNDSQIPHEFIELGKINVRTVDTPYLLDTFATMQKVIRIAQEQDADAVSNIHFEPAGKELRGNIGPPTYQVVYNVNASLIKYLKYIPVCDSSYITLTFPNKFFAAIKVCDSNGKDITKIDDETKSIYNIKTSNWQTGIYGFSIIATDRPGWTKVASEWVATRWIEIRR